MSRRLSSRRLAMWSACLLVGLGGCVLVGGAGGAGGNGEEVLAVRPPEFADHVVNAIEACEGLVPHRLEKGWLVLEHGEGTRTYTKRLWRPERDDKLGLVSVRARDTQITGVTWRISTRLTPTPTTIAHEDARQVAERCSQRLLPLLFGDDALVRSGSGSGPSPDSDAWGFHWRRRAAPSGDPEKLVVHVNAFSGQIQTVSVSFSTIQRCDDPELRAQAIAMVVAAAAERGLPPVDEQDLLYETQRIEPLGGAGGTYRWHGLFFAEEKWPQEPTQLVCVLSATCYPTWMGVESVDPYRVPAEQAETARRETVSLSDAAEILQLPERPAESAVLDECPVPSSGGSRVLFLTDRAIQGYPSWRETMRYPVVTADRKDVAALAFSEYLPCVWAGATTSADWVAYLYASGLTMLDVTTGETYHLASGRGSLPPSPSMMSTRPWVVGTTPTWNGGLRWAAWHPAQDGGRRLVEADVRGFSRSDVAVSFGPTDEFAALAVRNEKPRGQTTYSVQHATVSGDCTIADRQTLVDGLRGEPLLSWTNHGTQLVVDDGEQALVITVEDAASTALGLDELRDLKNGAELVLVRPSVRALGSDGLVFTARQVGDAAEPGTHIYQCRLDGSGVTRFLVADEGPVEAYRFPATGEPAFVFPWEAVSAPAQE